MTTPSTSAQGPLDGIQISGRTLYKLDERGVNIWSANFQPNSGYSEVTADEAAQAVAKIVFAAVYPSPAASPASPSGVLDLYREAVRVDVKMEGPQFMGCNTSALKRAWEADRASLASDATPAPTSGSEDGGEHPDDLAVDRFAAAMKAKLAKKRAEGRGGWEDKEDCSNAFLSQLLREHTDKGDPVDVGNLAMMIHQRGERTG